MRSLKIRYMKKILIQEITILKNINVMISSLFFHFTLKSSIFNIKPIMCVMISIRWPTNIFYQKYNKIIRFTI